MKQVSIPITKVDEPWCKVVLANGAIITYRTIVKGAFQVMNDDGSPHIQADGKPLVGLDTQVVLGLEKEPVEKKDMN